MRIECIILPDGHAMVGTSVMGQMKARWGGTSDCSVGGLTAEEHGQVTAIFERLAVRLLPLIREEANTDEGEAE